jgi:hypothetical protein
MAAPRICGVGNIGGFDFRDGNICSQAVPIRIELAMLYTRGGDIMRSY